MYEPGLARCVRHGHTHTAPHSHPRPLPLLQEWSDLPEGPLKYMGVKVDPAHVAPGPVWSFFADWRTGVPAAFCLSLPYVARCRDTRMGSV